MTANNFIQMFGVLYILIGLAFLFNKKFYKSIFKDIIKSNTTILFGGIFGVVIGIMIMFFYYEVDFTREGLVTFVGLMAFLKGMISLLFPERFKKMVKFFSKTKYYDLATFFIIIVGVLLVYLGFFA